LQKRSLGLIALSSYLHTDSGGRLISSAYGPHTGGAGALQYIPFVETTRKIVLAIKRSKTQYFIMIGGCGSLYLPGQEDDTACDSRQWWLQYRRGIADSEAHVQYMEERLGHLGTSLRKYRTARLKTREGNATQEDRKTIQEYEDNVLNGDYSAAFVKACRTTFMFFDGNQSFKWSFLSPSALFRPGSTGLESCGGADCRTNGRICCAW
jgi:putative NADH-flavin reductase